MKRTTTNLLSLLTLSLAVGVGCGGPEPSSPDAPAPAEDVEEEEDPEEDVDPDPVTDPDPDPVTDPDPDPVTDPDPDPVVDPDPEPEEPGAPTIVASTPEDGETNVDAQSPLIVTFSEAMDTDSVEAAFSSETMGNVELDWNLAGTLLTITPEEILAAGLGFGTDPSGVDAIEHSYTIAASAKSAEGVELGADHVVSFHTYRVMYAEVGIVPALTRTVLSNGTVHSESMDELYAGDSSYVAETQMKGFVTFDLSALPEDADIVESALQAKQTELNGAPYETLGYLNVDHVQYDELSADTFDAESLAWLGYLSQDATLGAKDIDVDDEVRADFAAGDVTQFCFSFTSATDADDEGDSAELGKQDLKLGVLYTVE